MSTEDCTFEQICEGLIGPLIGISIDLQSFCIEASYDCAFNTDIKLENYQGPYAFLALYDLLYAELYIGDSVSDFRISITKRELFLIPEKAINVSQAITAELLNNKASY